MANIYSYPQIGELATNDTIAISDFSNGNKTQSVTIGQLSSYFNTGVVNNLLYETTITLGYADLALLNGGTTTTTFAIPGLTSTSALAIVDITAYLEVGTIPFDATNSLLIGLGSGLDFKNRSVIDNVSLINSSSSVYINRGGADFIIGNLQPTPLGAQLSIKFDGSGVVTQGDGTLTLKVLYRLIDFS
jgi:hypothetical protein